MKVTIITVAFNSAAYLEDCIQSVIGQRYHDIEHIIVDGGSTDGTLDIINQYEGNIARWISEKDSGMYDAINKGMKMATGDVIGILNSDDMLATCDVISSIVNSFNRYKVGAVYGDIIYVHPVNTATIHRVWKGDEYNRQKFEYGWMPAHPSFYIRKSLIEKCGYYETHFFTAADYEFMTRYLYYHRVAAVYLPKLIVKMRVGGMSNKSIARRLRANRRDYLAMKKNAIPYALIVSILKPLRKLLQYRTKAIHSFSFKFNKPVKQPLFTPVNPVTHRSIGKYDSANLEPGMKTAG
ncbi:MAG: glycosyltransferase [Ferruginibacter sp.]|nr:glycosyltransferase [Ferruginibacter sp.]